MTLNHVDDPSGIVWYKNCRSERRVVVDIMISSIGGSTAKSRLQRTVLVLAFFAISSVFIVGSEVSAFAQERVPSVLIFPIRLLGFSLNSAQQLDVRAYLGTRLTMEKVFRVMPEAQIKRDLGAAKVMSYQDCYDESCRLDLTKALSADKSLSVAVAKEEQMCRVTANLYDTVTEVTESAADVLSECSYVALKNAMKAVAAQLSGRESDIPQGSAAATNASGSEKSVTQVQSANNPGAAGQGAADLSWVRIPAGHQVVGSNSASADISEKPAHPVKLKAFDISRSEITIREYAACVNQSSCSFPRKGGQCNWGKPDRLDHPVNCVDWMQAAEFASWAGGRLPSEAEWEYAARGGSESEYPWGNEPPSCDRAVFAVNGGGCGWKSTWKVCSKPLGNTSSGLCDMAGNVREWVSDSWSVDYQAASFDGTAMHSAYKTYRVNRGGSWQSLPRWLRCSARNKDYQKDRLPDIGFRIVRDVN